VAAGIFGLQTFGGLGGVSFGAQLTGSLLGVSFAFIFGFITYKVINMFSPIRLDQESEYDGADISIHKITATPNIDR
jgi:Amt family ammonium transporter